MAMAIWMPLLYADNGQPRHLPIPRKFPENLFFLKAIATVSARLGQRPISQPML